MITGTLTDYEASVWESLDIDRHFPPSLLPSASNLLEGPDKSALPRDGVSEMFENPLPRNSSVMKCLKRCGLERRGGVRRFQALWQIIGRFLMAERVIQHLGLVINKLQSEARRLNQRLLKRRSDFIFHSRWWRWRNHIWVLWSADSVRLLK